MNSPNTLKQLLPEQSYYAGRAAELKRQALGQTPGAGEALVTPEFRGAALAIQDCRLPEWIIAGPAETGKTVGSLWLLDSLARKYKNSQWAIIRKVHKDLHSTVIKKFVTLFCRTGISIYGGSKPEWFDYPNGSRIWCGGLDRPGAFLSGELDGIYINQAEETSLEDWEILGTRTTGRAGNVDFGGMIFGDANPGPPTSWIKHRESLRLFESRHEDNPALFTVDGQITERGQRTMMVLDKLTGVRKERLRYGRWVAAEGTVYEYDPAIHLLDYNTSQFPYPSIPVEWRRVRGIDFGFMHPFVCHWWAIDPDGRMYLYRQIHMTKRTVKVHAAQINALSAGEDIEQTVTDHDAEDRATLEECGIYSIPAVKDISPGIQSVQERLKILDDGKPRLFIMRGSLVERDEELADARKPTCLEEELDVYSWPKASDGKPIKEAPIKLFDDGADTMRYDVMYVNGMENAGPWFYE